MYLLCSDPQAEFSGVGASLTFIDTHDHRRIEAGFNMAEHRAAD